MQLMYSSAPADSAASSFTHTEIFDMYIIYIQIVLKNKHKCFPISRNMHI